MNLALWQCVLFSVLTGPPFFSNAQKDPFTIDDFFSGRFGSRGYGGQWVSDKEVQLTDSGGNVIVRNVETNATRTILASNVLSSVGAQSYTFSPDGQLVLISYQTQSQFRHSTTAKFTVYTTSSGTYADVANAAFLQTAHWGPNGRSLLYVLDNDIYYVADFGTSTVKRVTNSGIPGVIYNGVPDWVYEEEVLGAATAYWFSPDGGYLLYLEFNDTEVPEMTYMHYGKPGTVEDQYPTEITIRYPKAGARNPSHTSYIVKLTETVLRPLPIRSDSTGTTVTFGLNWISNTNFTEQIMSRVQNESTVHLCDVDRECRELYSSNNDRGWIRERPIRFQSSSQSYITIESVSAGGETFSHLAIREPISSSLSFLTNGKFNVLNIDGWNEKSGDIYFSATEEGHHSRTQIYRTNINDVSVSCLSCAIKSPEGNGCTSASARYSKDFTYSIVSCSAPDPTFVSLYRMSKTPELVYDLETNTALRELIKTKALPTTVDYTVPLAGGFEAKVRLLVPPNIDSNKKYPLIVNVYAGPDSNQVVDGFSLGWQTYLTSSLNIFHATIDGRGSGRRSDELLFANYKALGTLEIIDQINATSYIQGLPSIDATRSAIWGWSYGGYATGRALELDTQGVFKCGISVAPVTSWLYYDSIYTERYMSLPTKEDNLAAYVNGDLVSNPTNLKNKQYYLIHGNGDDNVHYQQSMLLSRSLETADILFQQQSYPDENHGLGGVSRHLYHSMDKFWKNCFNLS